MTEEPTDAALLRGTAAGDEAAFDRFVERHRAAVFRYARSRGSDADAEEVLQQTFVSAWRNAGKVTIAGSARPWLFTVARNAMVRLHRPRRSGVVELPLEDLGAAAGFAAATATPERFAAATEERELLEQALLALPDTDREVLHLRDLEQLPGDDVAALLGLTLTAMKSRLHRARLRLVAEVRRLLPEENR
ncbi:MAG: RNA polymerase sigma factor [Planctomycetota bacterium]